jgi:hypothetical protein
MNLKFLRIYQKNNLVSEIKFCQKYLVDYVKCHISTNKIIIYVILSKKNINILNKKN